MQDIETSNSQLKASAHVPYAKQPDVARDAPPDAANPYAPHALALLSSALLAACGGGGGGADGAGGPAEDNSGIANAPGFNNFAEAKTDAEAARFLQQSQFASTPADIAAVRSKNYAAYLRQQFAIGIDAEPTGWQWLESKGYGADAALPKNVYNSTMADFMIWRDLMSSKNPTRKRVALALSEFFVVSINSMEIDWRGYTITAYWDLLNKHAFGNFRNLLKDITLNPAMGHYLNTRGNQKEDGKGRLPDENYAREVMQLFTIGLYELEINGNIKMEGGKRKETYTSADVSELARVFTGYDFDPAYRDKADFVEDGKKKYSVYAREYARQPMKVDSNKHSKLAVNFLGKAIGENTQPDVALDTALDILFMHPNVGPFFGRQMIQRLVTSDPSPEYVARVASAFNNNGAGVRGDLKAVWTAILLDDEARGAASLSDDFFGKLREPMIRLVQWARTFGAVSKQGNWKIGDLSDISYSMGQSPLHSPSVFNFFRPGYVPPGTALASAKATAPEFQLVNETTVGSYVNFMQWVIREGINTENPATPEVVYNNYTRSDIQGNYTELLAIINNSASNDAEAQRVSQALVSRLNLLLTAGQLSVDSLAKITTAIKAAMLQSDKQITNANTTQMDTRRRDLVAAAIFLIMASPDYLVQK